MDVFLSIAGGVLIIIGFLGTFAPVLPGAPLSWIGLLVASFSSYSKVHVAALIVSAIFAVIVSILDNVFPVMLTKKSGGSKEGTWGSTIGIIVGIIIGPIGILVGPFIGAFIGEMIHDSSDVRHAAQAAFGAFKGFLLGTGMKMIVCIGILWIYLYALIKGLSQG